MTEMTDGKTGVPDGPDDDNEPGKDTKRKVPV